MPSLEPLERILILRSNYLKVTKISIDTLYNERYRIKYSCLYLQEKISFVPSPPSPADSGEKKEKIEIPQIFIITRRRAKVVTDARGGIFPRVVSSKVPRIMISLGGRGVKHFHANARCKPGEWPRNLNAIMNIFRPRAGTGVLPTRISIFIRIRSPPSSPLLSTSFARSWNMHSRCKGGVPVFTRRRNTPRALDTDSLSTKGRRKFSSVSSWNWI